VAQKFYVELVKASHYDREGYVVQWWKAWVPSNSLACLYTIAEDCGARRILGDDVDIEVDGHDEQNCVLPVERIAAKLTAPGKSGLVCMTGVQSNQYPRALALAKRFRARGVNVAIGGFHVSGVLAMLKKLTPELQDAVDHGIVLFAGEAEEHFEHLLKDVAAGSAKPVYNFMDDLPDLRGAPAPVLPARLVKRYDGVMSSFDAGRGCPFQCTFCTIINVQGRKSRWRDADDVEKILRANLAQGVEKFFITDDNFARNRNWEPIFDRMIELSEREGLHVHFFIQVDTLAHKIPNFVEKAARAGCRYVFVGLESINAANLKEMGKAQNRITEYRKTFQAWKKVGVVTFAGYILGLPDDSRESIRRDIEVMQRELPVDLVEFTMLTPLPGSEDHKRLYDKGVWMDPDLNAYDLENVTLEHPKMTKEEWQQTYFDAWDWYYSEEHLERLARRNAAYGIKTIRVLRAALQIVAAARFEGVHPLQGGYYRIKQRKERRPELPIESPLVFYPRRVAELAKKYSGALAFGWKLLKLRKRIESDPMKRSYVDVAIADVVDAENETMQMFELNDSARAAVTKAKKAKALAGA
jgi:radical SAM superfamily enzyme YgiQ (UPF0313 family)